MNSCSCFAGLNTKGILQGYMRILLGYMGYITVIQRLYYMDKWAILQRYKRVYYRDTWGILQGYKRVYYRDTWVYYRDTKCILHGYMGYITGI